MDEASCRIDGAVRAGSVGGATANRAAHTLDVAVHLMLWKSDKANVYVNRFLSFLFW